MDFVSTTFSMATWEAFALVRSTDVFLGMHGAGFANLFVMHQVNAHGWGLQSVQTLCKEGKVRYVR